LDLFKFNTQKDFSMPDPRITKLAQVLVHYSLDLKPGERFVMRTSPSAEELNLAVYEEAIKAGAFVTIMQSIPGARQIFYKYASPDQLEHINDFEKLTTETYNAYLAIDAATNTRELSGIDPKLFAQVSKANAPLEKTFMERAASGKFRWSLTVFPTQAFAQEAEMSLPDYRDFVYGAGMLNEPDPVVYWKKVAKEQKKIVDWLAGHDRVILKGSSVDLKMSVKGRKFISADGKNNFPDGEIFTGPVEDTPEGWIRFSYPAIEYGQEVADIELTFEKGKAIKEKASKNQKLLTGQLNSDKGARYLGELGIGTNYGIQKFTKHMLFDEKIGGTIHLALGASYPETGGKNESGIHWDMLCDMKDAEITVDGELFYKNGKVVIS
jgi:aminopeptidase